MTFQQEAKEINTPAANDIQWRRTWLTRLFRLFPWSYQYKLAERLVNEANALRVASPKDGYEWVDRREGLMKGMGAQEAANRIGRDLGEPNDV
jgi:hypothetical protein